MGRAIAVPGAIAGFWRIFARATRSGVRIRAGCVKFPAVVERGLVGLGGPGVGRLEFYIPLINGRPPGIPGHGITASMIKNASP
jgi:hypothetical protein